MSKSYRAWDPDQTYLLPPSPRAWLPDGDLVYFMLDVTQTLDLSGLTRKYSSQQPTVAFAFCRHHHIPHSDAFGLGLIERRMLQLIRRYRER